MTGPKSDLIELNMDHDTGKTAWLPLSQIEITRSDAGDFWVIDLPEWLAIEKELV